MDEDNIYILPCDGATQERLARRAVDILNQSLDFKPKSSLWGFLSRLPFKKRMAAQAAVVDHETVTVEHRTEWAS